MRPLGPIVVFVVMLSLLLPTAAAPADDAKVKEGMSQVERGAKKIPSSQIGEGVQETAKGVGTTVSEGAKYGGDKLKEAGQAAEPPAKSACGHARDGAASVGRSVKSFFTNLFWAPAEIGRTLGLSEQAVCSIVGMLAEAGKVRINSVERIG